MKKEHKIFICTVILLYMAITVFGGVPKAYRTLFSYCFSDIKTSLNLKLNIDGYYETYSIIKRSYNPYGGNPDNPSDFYMDTTYSRIMFYDNGLFISDIGDYNLDRYIYDEKKRKYTGKGNLPLALKEIAENTNSNSAKYSFYEGKSWGRYILSGDTIKVQLFSIPAALLSAYNGSFEIWYKIIDRNTIFFLKSMPLNEKRQKIYEMEKAKEEKVYQFHLIPTKPDPNNSWILREKWFWCNENDWKKFMNNRKK